jgi:hypothetical protein
MPSGVVEDAAPPELVLESVEPVLGAVVVEESLLWAPALPTSAAPIAPPAKVVPTSAAAAAALRKGLMGVLLGSGDRRVPATGPKVVGGDKRPSQCG